MNVWKETKEKLIHNLKELELLLKQRNNVMIWKEISKEWFWIKELQLLKKLPWWKKWPIKKEDLLKVIFKEWDSRWLNKLSLLLKKEMPVNVILKTLKLTKINIVTITLLLTLTCIKIVKIPNNIVWCVARMKSVSNTHLLEMNV